MTVVAYHHPPGLSANPELAALFVHPGRPSAGDPAMPTGLTPLDTLLGGGFPRGRISEVIGPRSSGRTSLLLGSLARVTASGALAALVDATDALDPVSAAAVGVHLDHLLWVRCSGRPVTALRAADILVRGGGFGVIVVDLGELPPWALARVPAAAFVRLQRAVEGTPTALVFAGGRRVAGSLAAVAVALGRSRAHWAAGGPGLLARLTAEVRLVRSRVRAPGSGVRVSWPLEDSPDLVSGTRDA